MTAAANKPGPSRVLVLALCAVVCMVDNYDNTALAFVMPHLSREWGISKLLAGSIFSAGLVGLLVGSILFGWIGDRFGRRTAILLGTGSFGIITLLTIFARDPSQLMALRFAAGLGIGGALPNVVAIANENAPARWKVFIIALIFAGYTLGGSGGGFVSALLIPIYGWQVVFVIGGLAPLLLLPVLATLLPASRPRRTADEPRAGIAALFVGARGVMTLLLWLIYIMNSAVVFALSNWLPTLIQNTGQPVGRAAIAAALFSVGGSIGGLVASGAVDRKGLTVLVLFIAIGCPLVATIGRFDATSLFVVIALAGFFVVGTQNSLHGVAASIYPSSIRASGVGFALGIAKIGSISGPFVIGMLLSANVPLATLFLLVAIPLVVACLAAAVLMHFYDRHIRSGTLEGEMADALAASPAIRLAPGSALL